jgi:hypothetical protein
MPAVSKKQFKFMAMMAHNPEKAKKKGGISPSKAKEFVDKTKSYGKLPEKK